MLDRVKKPELLITQKVGEVPVRGICSACPHIVFDIGSKRGKRGDHERKLKKLFSEHLKRYMRHRCTQETHTETCSICHAVFCPACLSFHQHQKPASADHRRAANEQPHDILQYATAPPWPNTFAQTNPVMLTFCLRRSGGPYIPSRQNPDIMGFWKG